MDEVAVREPSRYHDHPLLCRRNFNLTPTKLALIPHHNSTTNTATATSSFSPFPSDDLELLLINPVSQSYTSLRDLLPASVVNSPKPTPHRQAQSGSDICIRNRLVKQAAWAYLQPMSSTPGPSGDGFFRRLWSRVTSFLDFARRTVDCALRIFWIRRTI